MSKPYLFMMMGYAGSGKSYFARGLALEAGALRLNADAVRNGIFGSRSAANDFEPQSVVHRLVRGAVDSLTQLSLELGESVVIDASMNIRERRMALSEVAQRVGGLSAVVCVETPVELAMRRLQNRDETSDQIRFSAQDARQAIDKDRFLTQPPMADENIITVPGIIPFEEQYESFKKQLMEIENE